MRKTRLLGELFLPKHISTTVGTPALDSYRKPLTDKVVMATSSQSLNQRVVGSSPTGGTYKALHYNELCKAFSLGITCPNFAKQL